MTPHQFQFYPGTAYLHLRPGITGTWQVSERHQSAFVDRARYDEEYFRELSFRTDVRIILATIPAVLDGTGQ
jgi:lipopolysaccharide/colanic/teichoic acid biosynthesis glycosyltransferase